MKQIQFELWKECNQGCIFCYLGDTNKHTDDKIKIENLKNTYNTIYNMDKKDTYTIGFIGGEFFQGQLRNNKVREEFFKLISLCNDYINKGYIEELWICATLSIGSQKDLFECIDLIDNKSKIWILTSYDTVGRFNFKLMQDNWKSNIIKLHNLYPDISINITSILTGDFIDKYISNNLKDLEELKTIGCSQFLKPPAVIQVGNDFLSKEKVNSIIPNFFPTRSQFLNFLMTYKNRENEFMYYKLFNMEFRSEYLIRYGDTQIMRHRVKDKSEEVTLGEEMENSPCGHSIQYRCYIDTDNCCICDKEMIGNMY